METVTGEAKILSKQATALKRCITYFGESVLLRLTKKVSYVYRKGTKNIPHLMVFHNCYLICNFSLLTI